jgi:hypothetical protein
VDECRPDIDEQRATCSASETDLFESRLLYGGSEGSTKELEPESGVNQIACGLISLAALLSLLAGIFCLPEADIMRASDSDEARFAAEGVPGQSTFTMGQAIQTLSLRHQQ